MPDVIFKAIYLLGLLFEMAIRAPLNRQRRQIRVANDRVTTQEKVLLGLLFVGTFWIPLAYVFTLWLDFANYQLPVWAGWLGAVIFVAALWVFWRSHVDLGRNWSPSLQILERHSLVTSGIYGYIRHPMYASHWLWSIAQVLLLQNWIAGFASLVTFIPMYLWRVRQEEQMMLEHFGEEYRSYMERTGRVIPRLRAP